MIRSQSEDGLGESVGSKRALVWGGGQARGQRRYSNESKQAKIHVCVRACVCACVRRCACLPASFSVHLSV